MSHPDEQSLFEMHQEGASAEAETHNEESENYLPIAFEQVVNPTKVNAVDIAKQLISQVENGEIDPVVMGVRIKWLIEILETTYSGQFKEVYNKETGKKDKVRVFEGIEPFVRAAAEKFGKEGVSTIGGARIDLAEVGTRYDFSKDHVWVELQEKLEPIKAEIKERETMLKTLKKPFEQVDPTTGEVIVVSPPLKTSVSSVRISLGK